LCDRQGCCLPGNFEIGTMSHWKRNNERKNRRGLLYQIFRKKQNSNPAKLVSGLSLSPVTPCMSIEKPLK
jgi:hypothetical protein